MASQLQALLRFLSQDAKLPLATAMSKIKELQKEGLVEYVVALRSCGQLVDIVSVSTIAKADVSKLQSVFLDEKPAKQVLNAAKRVSKKRPTTDGDDKAASKKARKSTARTEPTTPAEIEASIALPESDLSEGDLARVVLFTNRAPLVLAFVITLLKYLMPNQPLSSRLSLAQAYVSITSRSRAVYLGIETGKSAEEEGFGEGQPTVTIMGKELRVMKRHGYEWRDVDAKVPDTEQEPAVWGVDLEALKKSESSNATFHSSSTGSTLPIYTPQSARAYLLKSFDSPKDESEASSPKKKTAAAAKETKEANLGHLLKALDLLYSSWSTQLQPKELDNRSWSWYMAVRPAVAEGVAGWGGKNNLKLSDILKLKRQNPD